MTRRFRHQLADQAAFVDFAVGFQRRFCCTRRKEQGLVRDTVAPFRVRGHAVVTPLYSRRYLALSHLVGVTTPWR